jgi:hypothetical protein
LRQGGERRHVSVLSLTLGAGADHAGRRAAAGEVGTCNRSAVSVSALRSHDAWLFDVAGIRWAWRRVVAGHRPCSGKDAPGRPGTEGRNMAAGVPGRLVGVLLALCERHIMTPFHRTSTRTFPGPPLRPECAKPPCRDWIDAASLIATVASGAGSYEPTRGGWGSP